MTSFLDRVVKRICANHVGCADPCEACFEKAFFILQDMREPTADMVQIGDDIVNGFGPIWDYDARKVWRAMLNTALKHD